MDIYYYEVSNDGIKPLVRHCCERVAVKKAAQSGLYVPREVPHRAAREAQGEVTSLRALKKQGV